ncbi:putative conserved transmembrane domain near C-terminus [Cryptosporidium bovis]|uniref:putative conserved transmembrane domain near C-terminus n=1 Tax=Cryptosporidium bovis TaxID=310047 RepID=UPI00351A6261|nr:putative conserved transmembrane domain near C-terminus [Cryptosporidium bovis]
MDDTDFFSDGNLKSRNFKSHIRVARKRANVQTSIKELAEVPKEPAGVVWACCFANELDFQIILEAWKQGELSIKHIHIEMTFSEVLCLRWNDKICYLFRFGCVVGWDLTRTERIAIVNLLKGYVNQPLHTSTNKLQDDDMNYNYGEKPSIKHDSIYLVSDSLLEKLAYSYALSQSVKLSIFEYVVDETIESTRSLPESLAKTGTIKDNREDISKRIGELFMNRFYINLQTDILDTPDIFWELQDFETPYLACRNYMDIPKRVEVLNQRLDIIKDLYDMLNNELSLQHGYKLEWIVIYLICIEILIEIVWNIVIRDIFRLF